MAGSLCQLGVLIGKKGKNISAQDAMAHVGGYFLGLDMTDREKQWELKKAGLPFDLSKGQVPK
jgi:2-keto-4-pentenoate hydratase/2-oxohepta-3-ene-1,7-dioic acid hydratase in catechol pathway